MSWFDQGSRFGRFAPPIAIIAAITWASSREGSQLPSLAFSFSDKLVHAAAFAILGFFWARALAPRALGPVIAVVICVVFGALDELHQSIVPGRFPDVFDGLADTVGACLGVAFYIWWRSRPREETHGDTP